MTDSGYSSEADLTVLSADQSSHVSFNGYSDPAQTATTWMTPPFNPYVHPPPPSGYSSYFDGAHAFGFPMPIQSDHPQAMHSHYFGAPWPHPSVVPAPGTRNHCNCAQHPAVIFHLIVNYLPMELDTYAMWQLFSAIRCGAESSFVCCNIVRHRETHTSAGFGFVTYYDAMDADQAIKSLNGLKVLNKTIKVSYARPGDRPASPGMDIRKANISIKRIPGNWTREDFDYYVGRCSSGEARNIKSTLVDDKLSTKEGERIGYVILNSQRDVWLAVRELTRPFIDAYRNRVRLDVRLPKPSQRNR